MGPPLLTPAMQDYLKHIFHLSASGGAVGTNSLAAHLNVAAPSATNMIKRLAELDLVVHSPYRGIELTPEGRAMAVEMVRHHRLVELYLARFLDVPWDQVHAEAERLEHAISEDLERRMAEKLGHPDFDPHGDPIPSSEGTFPDRRTGSLWDAGPGEELELVRVCDQDPGLLHYLGQLHIVPGARLGVVQTSPYGGTLTVRVGGVEHVIGCDLARGLLCEPAPAERNREIAE